MEQRLTHDELTDWLDRHFKRDSKALARKDSNREDLLQTIVENKFKSYPHDTQLHDGVRYSTRDATPLAARYQESGLFTTESPNAYTIDVLYRGDNTYFTHRFSLKKSWGSMMRGWFGLALGSIPVWMILTAGMPGPLKIMPLPAGLAVIGWIISVFFWHEAGAMLSSEIQNVDDDRLQSYLNENGYLRGFEASGGSGGELSTQHTRDETYLFTPEFDDVYRELYGQIEQA